MNILIIIVFAKMLHLLNLIIKMHTIQLLIFSNICNLASNSLPFYWLTIIFIYIYTVECLKLFKINWCTERLIHMQYEQQCIFRVSSKEHLWSC